MKNKIIMLLSFLLLWGAETTAQEQKLTRLTAEQVVPGKRIMIRKIKNDDRGFFKGPIDNKNSLPVGNSIYVVESAETAGKILLKRDRGNYLGRNGNNIALVEKANAMEFSVVKPSYTADEKSDLNLTDQNLRHSDVSEDFLVRFITTIPDNEGTKNVYLNLDYRDYRDGKGIWSAGEVYEVGTETTGGVLSDASGTYLLWKTNDGKVLTAQSATQGGLFVANNYSENNAAMQQWQTVDTGEEGKIRLYNVGTGLYLSAAQQSDNVLGFTEKDLAESYEHLLVGTNEVFASTTNTEEGGRYLHCNNGNLVGWADGSNDNNNGVYASQWRLITVEQLETVQKNHERIGEFAPLLEEYEGLFKLRYPFGKENGGLITNVNQISVNFIATNDGSKEGLIDGDISTHFHTGYGNEIGDGSPHYLQLSINEGDRSNRYIVRYAARNGNNRPTKIKLYGVNGEDVIDLEYELTKENAGLGADDGFIFIDLTKQNGSQYEALRFEVTETNTNTVFFTYGEFQIFKLSNNVQNDWETLLSNWDKMHSMIPGNTLDYVKDDFGKKLKEMETCIERTKDIFGTAEVTYNYYYNNNLLASETFDIPSKGTFPDIPQYNWVTAAKPEGIIEDHVSYDEDDGTCIIRIDYTFDESSNCPVKNSNVSDGEGEYKWNLITLNNGNNNVSIDSDGNTYSPKDESKRFEKASWFAFEMVDPSKSAFRIYAHNGSGNVHKLGSTETTNNNGADGPIIVENEENDVLWTLSASGNNWRLKLTDNNCWWNRYGGGDSERLKYWSSGDDLNFISEEAFLTELTAPYRELIAIHELLPEGKYLGLPSNNSENVTTAQQIITAANDGINGITPELYALTVQAPVNGKNVENGKYYRLFNATTTHRIEEGKCPTLGFEKNGSTIYAKGLAASTKDAGSVWLFEAADNGFALYNPSTQNYLQAVTQGSNTKTTMNATKQSYEALYQSNGKFLIHISGANDATRCINLEGSSNNLHYINSWNGDNAKWYIAEAKVLEVDLRENDLDAWTSVFLPFAVEVPGGVEIYGAENSGNKLLLHLSESNSLAAREGALLKGTAENGGAGTVTVSLNILDDEVATMTDNDLRGVTIDTDTPAGTVYALSKFNGKLAFYHYEGQTVPAYKAYVVDPNPTGTSAKYFDFGSVTNIEEIPTSDNNEAAPIYDLSGRRVQQAGKGFYIVGGRKVIR